MSRCYTETLPPAPYRAWLLCSWQQDIGKDAGVHSQRVLPDGCIDMVWIGENAPVVAGPATRSQLFRLAAGTRVTGLRFRPAAAAAVLGVAANALLDQHVPLAEVCRPLCGPLAGLRFDETETAQGRVARQLAALASRLGHAPAPDPMMLQTTAWLARHPQGRIETLARAIGLDRRELHRRFCAEVGYSPKTFQRVMRLQYLLSAAGSSGSLSQLASASGYADQAHMCRDVLALSGQTPRLLLANGGSTLELADLFNTDCRP